MGVVSLGSNISAMMAQRRLSESTTALGKSLEKLSSGLRINRASDDAAGLAISLGLSASSRVYGQGLRNVNDAISLLNVAQGTGDELTSVLTRMKELATSSANGTLSRAQRISLDAEAYELQKEYNRLVATANFNGRTLLDGNFGKLNIQAGFGQRGLLSFDLGTGLQRNSGTGTYGTQIGGTGSYQDTTMNPFNTVGDFNGDGKEDLFLMSDGTLNFSNVLLSNGDGTFASVSSSPPDVSGDFAGAVGDINGDGKLDVVTTGHILLGNGDGTFRSGGTIAASDYTINLSDMNGDGRLDIVAATGAAVQVYLGNGNGSFSSAINTTITSAGSLQVGDFNGDGKKDIAASDGSSKIRLYSGAGNGHFALSTTFNTTGGSTLVSSGDQNHDGIDDLLVADANYTARLLTGTTSGNFSVAQSFAPSVGVAQGELVDLNNDGLLDVVTAGGGYNSIYIANTDGSFSRESDVGGDSIGTGQEGYISADVNGDGVKDLLCSDPAITELYVCLGESVKTTGMQRLNLTSREGALSALTTIDQAISRVSSELSTIGSNQSRLSSVLSTVSATQLNSNAANGRIIDADVSSESAALTAKQILQQAAAAVLGQANQLPTLALTLLR